MVKRKKTNHNRIILGVSSFAALEVRLTVGISPGTTSNPSAARSQGMSYELWKILNVQRGVLSKDTAIIATRSNGIETHTDTEYECLSWSVREIRIEGNSAARAPKPRPPPFGNLCCSSWVFRMFTLYFRSILGGRSMYGPPRNCKSKVRNAASTLPAWNALRPADRWN